MLQSERVERLVFDLPGHNGGSVPVAFHDPPGEIHRSGAQFCVRRRSNQGSLRDPALSVVSRYEELRVPERFDRAGADNDGFPGLFGRFYLPVQLTGVKATRLALHMVPVGRQPHEVVRVA